ncbi:hypothetical protein AVEN_198297-1 [Araneus ventricosus]|uniref:Uncharacterized protein n=1 Tax=Araneus ventricosus TaxID=182803 RepID=A0A4Y2JYH2_ARAVE|nr:hypothetical protein AVEN_198297-1 [Araneus ventricosus]
MDKEPIILTTFYVQIRQMINQTENQPAEVYSNLEITNGCQTTQTMLHSLSTKLDMFSAANTQVVVWLINLTKDPGLPTISTSYNFMRQISLALSYHKSTSFKSKHIDVKGNFITYDTSERD